MARNEARRAELVDAGLRVLAAHGARGLTHRAVDREARVPAGTCSNYFRSRADLVEALARGVFERIGPTPERLAELAELPPTIDASVVYVRDIVRRLLGHADLSVALFELRLEARRNPEVAEVVGSTLRRGFVDDVAFNAERGLPGGATEILLLHHALDGLVLDALTTPLVTDADLDEITDTLVRRLLPE